MGTHMHIYPNNQTNKWRVYGLYFLFGLCSLYIMQWAGFCMFVCQATFCICVNSFSSWCTHLSFIFAHAYIYMKTQPRVCLCVCLYVHNTVLSAWVNIYSTHSPVHPLLSLRLARTCMSVDSVPRLLPWHAPTSLQCSPVCINWQGDSGYVVCRVGRIETERKNWEGRWEAT